MKMDPSELVRLGIGVEHVQRAADFFQSLCGSTGAMVPPNIPGQELLGAIPYGSDEGCQKREASDEFKERGNAAFKEKKYEEAGMLYLAALGLAEQVQNNAEQIGTLQCNFSRVSALVGSFDSAFIAARSCVTNRPNWFKGALRMMQAYIGLKKFQDAFNVGLILLQHYDIPQQQRPETFTEFISLIPKIQDYTKLDASKIKPEEWKGIIERLETTKSWEAISILFQGREGSPPILTSYRATNLDLSGLLGSCSVAQWKSWGQRLAVKLLQAGAKMASLDPEKKHGAHAAFQMCMKTGLYELLKHLFLRHIPTNDRDRVDDEGNTLLHLACRTKCKTRVMAIKLLLEYNLNPSCQNNTGQRPLDLLAGDDVDRTTITQAIQSAGYVLPDLVSAPTAGKGSQSADDIVTRDLQAGTCTFYSAQQPQQMADLQMQSWTRQQVCDWMNDNGIQKILASLGDMDGRQLAELRTLQETAAPTFYQLLHGTLGLSFVQLLTVASAIRELR